MNLFKKILACMSVIAISSALVLTSFAGGKAQWRRNYTGWWYEEADGSYPVNAWKYIDNEWYYFDAAGYMVMNCWIGNYYLGEDGAMLVSTKTPDGYYVDENGKWIEDKTPEQSGGNGGSSGGSSSSGETNTKTKVLNELMSQGLSNKEAKLYFLVNEYRASLGLKKLSFSKSLTTVARTHVADSNAYSPENQVDARGIKGNLHSWSANGSWNPVVYTPDHHYKELMWSKPRELTSYTGYGYEISVGTSGYSMTPEKALDSWKGSSGHNAVIIGSGDWSMLKTMGVSIEGGYAHIWFGSDPDPAGYYDVTGYEVVHP